MAVFGQACFQLAGQIADAIDRLLPVKGANTGESPHDFVVRRLGRARAKYEEISLNPWNSQSQKGKGKIARWFV